VKVVYSALDAVDIAEGNPDRKVIFLGIGFETTSPTVAASLTYAKEKKLINFFVYSGHKIVLPAMKALLGDHEVNIDGFLCYTPLATSAKIASLGFEDFEATDWEVVEEKKKCVFCGKKGDWKTILRDASIVMKDGSDMILCDECINHYAAGDYDEIKLKEKKTLYDKRKWDIYRGAERAEYEEEDIKEAIKEFLEKTHHLLKDLGSTERIEIAKQIFGDKLI